MPIINNIAAIIAVVGFIFALIALIKAKKAQAKCGMPIAGVICSVVAIVIVIVTQIIYVQAAKKVLGGPEVQAISSTLDSNAADAGKKDGDKKDGEKKDENASPQSLKLGSTVTLDNGLQITVKSIENGQKEQYSDETYAKLNVEYANTGKDQISLSSFNWKSQTSEGVIKDTMIVIGSDQKDQMLSSLKLAPGGKASGYIPLEDNSVKAFYFNNMFDDKPIATWELK